MNNDIIGSGDPIAIEESVTITERERLPESALSEIAQPDNDLEMKTQATSDNE